MPSYDYECTQCGHVFEEFQSMSDPVLTECPSCGTDGLKRLIGGGLGVIFKGSGFYVTDNKAGKSSSGSSRTGKEGSAKEGTASTAGSGSDSGTGASDAKTSEKAAVS
ncbi:FmdB family zinc ribbon protein [Spirochaeta lutea]|uniref:FmdB family transcriptional regulator n=1 Tax=Spirochaeta lutea TaxID=1480694 RepID=A0A098QTN9_9SPIO|nr:zinc ribbon domain-containing protein [Spirochaeta lutea]KGE70763.1 FmdB family transcriptional regulator [Spirochaeta lutea]